MGADRVYYERPGPVAAAAVALPVLAILAVCLRFYVRIKYKQGLKTDDWVLIPAAVCKPSGLLIVIIVNPKYSRFSISACHSWIWNRCFIRRREWGCRLPYPAAPE